MSIRNIMTMRATVERNIGMVDPYGGKTELWQTIDASAPCYAWEPGGKKIVGSAIVEITGPIAVMRKTQDITISDRISTIENRLGVEVYGKMVVESVALKSDHKEVRLKKIA